MSCSYGRVFGIAESNIMLLCALDLLHRTTQSHVEIRKCLIIGVCIRLNTARAQTHTHSQNTISLSSKSREKPNEEQQLK